MHIVDIICGGIFAASCRSKENIYMSLLCKWVHQILLSSFCQCKHSNTSNLLPQHNQRWKICWISHEVTEWFERMFASDEIRKYLCCTAVPLSMHSAIKGSVGISLLEEISTWVRFYLGTQTNACRIENVCGEKNPRTECNLNDYLIM